jgi:hypothetical protein
MPKNESWNEDEVDKAVQCYFTMLRRELEGEGYTKEDYKNEVAENTNRSVGAAGAKFQQISTVLDERGFRHVDGYTPRENYQQNLLEERIEEELDKNPALKSELRPEKLEQESRRRHEMWEQLRESGSPEGVQSSLVRDLNIYQGQAGIWRDKQRTAGLTDDGNGVTVSVLHTGQSYPDDLSKGGLIYHYPDTDRIGSRDENEVEATKNACRLEIPIFVVVYPEEDDSKRDVYLGRVADWNDETEEFLILFDADFNAPGETASEVREKDPFQLTSERSRRTSPQPSRPEQGRFRFNVFKRYGKKCAVCEIGVGEMLVAAHIRGKAEDGSDDARNGLVLCKNHHAAFDNGLFSIEPETHVIHTREEGPSKQKLKIEHSRLSPARSEPHEDAVRWHWERWKEEK